MNLKNISNKNTRTPRFVPKYLTVCNALNTSEYEYSGEGGWKEYWRENKTNIDFPRICPACGVPMSEDEAVGGHVMDYTNKKVYITPMHSGCNTKQKKLEPFEIEYKYLAPVPNGDSEDIINDARIPQAEKEKPEFLSNEEYIRTLKIWEEDKEYFANFDEFIEIFGTK